MTNGTKCLMYRAYAFIVYALPLVILLIINNGYITKGYKLGIWGILALGLIVLMFKEQFLKLFKAQPLINTSLIILFIAIAFKYIGDELFYISACSLLGSILSLVFGKVANVYENYRYKIVDGIKKKNRDIAISDKEAWKEAYGFKE